jgi:hypothetical protein
MISPFSSHFEKATVPMNATIPISKMISTNALESIAIERIAVMAIKLMPIASRAMTLSGVVGPFTRRKTNNKDEMATMNNERPMIN